MTKENARGVTHNAFKKVEELIGILCDIDFIDTQNADLDCDVEKMAEAVGHLTKAKIALKFAYDWRIK